jgi:hypothetical protein
MPAAFRKSRLFKGGFRVLCVLGQNQEAARTIANKNYTAHPLRQLAETLTPENWTQPNDHPPNGTPPAK